MAAKGDIISASANDVPLILTVGANDLVLTADSTEATGLKWASPGTSDIDISGSPEDDDIAVWTDADTVEGLSIAEFWAHISAGMTAADSMNEHNLTNVGTLGCDEITVVDGFSINLQEAITFLGATTENLIGFPDNLADALSFEEGGTAYMTFVTTDASEAVLLGQNLDVNFKQALNMVLQLVCCAWYTYTWWDIL